MEAARPLSPRTKALLAGALLILTLLPLGSRPLFTPDETRYAEIPREMIADGNWLVPRLCGLRYFEKPPLGYWLTALSFRALGLNPFAARLPDAILILLTGGLLSFFCRRWGEGEEVALAAGLIFLSFTMTRVLSLTNLPDPSLVFFTMLIS